MLKNVYSTIIVGSKWSDYWKEMKGLFPNLEQALFVTSWG